MCGSSDVPPPPPQVSAEEELNQLNLDMLRQSRAEMEGLRPLLLAESGLQSKADIPGTPEYEKKQTLQKNIGFYENALDSGVGPGGINLSKADINAYKDTLSKQKEELKTLGTQYAKTPERLSAEGRAKKLQEQVDLATERQLSLYGLQADRQEKALKGELPISEGTLQRKQEEFAALKERLTRAGNPVLGDTPETAYSPTTAGTQTLESFKRSYKLIEDSERQGELNQGSSALLGTLGLTSNIGNTRLAQSYETGAAGVPYQNLVGGPIGLINPSLQAQQPYQFNRDMQFQTGMQSAANAAAEKAGYLQLAGQTGASTALIAAAAMSSRSFKKDIKALSEKEEDRIAMSLTGKRKIYNWKYKTERDDSKGHIGLVTEESPDEIVTDDGKHLDIASYLGVLTISLRSMKRKMDALERRAA